MWRQTQWNALSGMFLPLCFRRGSSSVNATKAVRSVCACVCDRLTVFCGALIRPLLPPSCFVSFKFLRPSAVSSLFRSPLRPSPRESSDILRVCPAPHSSAASEECLVHNKQLNWSSIMISPCCCCRFEKQPAVI